MDPTEDILLEVLAEYDPDGRIDLSELGADELDLSEVDGDEELNFVAEALGLTGSEWGDE